MSRFINFILPLSFFVCSITIAQSHWELIQNTGNTLNDIISVNNDLYAVGNSGAAWKSTNNGASWNSLNTSTISNINKLKAHNNQLFALTEEGELLISANGGTTWNSQNLHSSALLDIDFQGTNGIIVGAQGFVFVSSNNGVSWTGVGQQSIFNLNGVLFVNDTLAVTIGSSGVSLKSTDNGNTWIDTNLPSSESFSSIAYDPHRNRVIAVGTNGTQGIYGINSNTWSISNVDENWLKDKYCNNDNTCYAVGFGSTVLIYLNSSPIEVEMEQEENINAIAAINDYVAFIVTTSGKIYKTETGAFLVNRLNIEKLELELFPNPVENRLYLSVNDKSYNYQIIDVSGKIILNGIFENQLDVTSLNQGTYLMILQDDQSFITKTFIKK